jgi:hypothetical protein
MGSMQVLAVAVQCMAISTNALLAWAPTVVRVDPVQEPESFYFAGANGRPLADS